MPALTLLLIFSAGSMADCEADVDLADSLNFDRFHGDCDSESNDKTGMNTATELPKTSEKPQGGPVAAQRPASSVGLSANSKALGEVMEPFSLNSGTQSAELGLLKQLSTVCPKGWHKEGEWVTAAEVGYVLHYGYRCI